jgi:hypothetical protein
VCFAALRLKSSKSANQFVMCFRFFSFYTQWAMPACVAHGCEAQLLRLTARNRPRHAHAPAVAASAPLPDD